MLVCPPILNISVEGVLDEIEELGKKLLHPDDYLYGFENTLRDKELLGSMYGHLASLVALCSESVKILDEQVKARVSAQDERKYKEEMRQTGVNPHFLSPHLKPRFGWGEDPNVA